MKAESYNILVRLTGSAAIGVALFSCGVILAFLFWGGRRKKARPADSAGDN